MKTQEDILKEIIELTKESNWVLALHSIKRIAEKQLREGMCDCAVKQAREDTNFLAMKEFNSGK